jgi:hypothetical protein
MYVVAPYYPWLALFLLGCYHGINPAMGWLFAVALGLQERRTTAVLGAIVPLVLGHMASVALVVLAAVFAATQFPHAVVHPVAAAILLVFGAYRLIRARHPRWVGMRVGFWGLALWGFLMSSAHGAGLMLLPFITGGPALTMHPMPPAVAMPAPGAGNQYAIGALMVAVHTLGYVVAMSAVAFVVYAKFGVRFLRKAWLNLDFVWGTALVVSGIIALLT